MTPTEDFSGLDKIAQALSKAQYQFTPIHKRRVANIGTYKYNYADLADCVLATQKALTENGIAWYQTVEQGEMVTVLVHISGQSISNRVPMSEAKVNTPQGLGSLFTYFRRYGFCQILGLVAEEDDDGASAQGEHTKMQPLATKPKIGTDPGPSEKQLKRLYAISASAGWSPEQVKAYMSKAFGVTSSKDLGWIQYSELCKFIEGNDPVEFTEPSELPFARKAP